MSVKAFFHCATINNWQPISDFFIVKLLAQPLIDKIYIGAVGPENAIAKTLYKHPKISFHDFGTELSQYEYPTLRLLYRECMKEPCSVLYLHTKGVTWTEECYLEMPDDFANRFKMCDNAYPCFTNINGVFDYKSLMRALWLLQRRLAWWLIDNADQNLKALETYDSCGLHFHETLKFWPRNFWWARSSHIQKLPLPYNHPNRVWAEFWLASIHEHTWFDFAKTTYCEPLPYNIKML